MNGRMEERKRGREEDRKQRDLFSHLHTSILPHFHTSVRCLSPRSSVSILVLLTALAFLLVPAVLGAGPADPVVTRVSFADEADLATLAGTLDVWEVHHAQKYIVALLRPDEYRQLVQAGYRIEIDAEKTARLDRTPAPAPNQTGGVPGYACYRTVDETYADLAQMADDHPDLTEWIDIGDTWEKSTLGEPAGYDLHALRVTNEAITGSKPMFFLVGAVHARELTTAEVAARFAETLVAEYGTDPDTTWLLDHYELHVVPMANPDGRKWAERGEYWRKNTNDGDGCTTFPYYGVDLNRNSSFKWSACASGSCSSSNACDQTYRGSGPASEPETLAIQDYVASLVPDRRGPADTDPAPADTQGVFITLHSYGGLVLFPWGWNPEPPPNDRELETLGRKFGYFTGYRVCQSGEPGCLYPTDGTTDDWAYGELGLASYTFELGTEFFESCETFEQTVLPASLDALRYAFRAARRPYLAPAGPDTLDVTAVPPVVAVGDPLTLTAVADDTRYDSGGSDVEPSQTVTTAQYSVDALPWEAVTTTPMFPADGAYDAVTETLHASIDTTTLEPGRHTIFVRSRDAAGMWGVPSAVFVTITQERHDLAVFPQHSMQIAEPDRSLTYTLRLTNSGSQSDTFDVAIGGNTWATSAPSTVGPLAALEATTLPISVTIPPTVALSSRDTVVFTVTSQAVPTPTVTGTLTTIAGWAYHLPVVER